jgi:hypothetical protein
MRPYLGGEALELSAIMLTCKSYNGGLNGWNCVAGTTYLLDIINANMML